MGHVQGWSCKYRQGNRGYNKGGAVGNRGTLQYVQHRQGLHQQKHIITDWRADRLQVLVHIFLLASGQSCNFILATTHAPHGFMAI